MREISVIEARSLAEEAALANLRTFLKEPQENVLRDEFVEGENCWFFFRNPSISVPPDKALKGDWAYAVSRRGQVREIADMSGEPERLTDYLKVMSDFFARNEG